MILKVDNIFPERLVNEMEELFFDSNFSWHLMDKTAADKHVVDNKAVDEKSSDKIKESPFFTKLLIPNGGPLQDRITPFLYFLEHIFKIKIEQLSRVKSNLYLQTKDYTSENYHRPHIDNPNENYYSFLYYVNDSDGDTFYFKDNEKFEIADRITPKKGTGVLAKSDIWHASSSPIVSDKRCTLNFIFKVSYDTVGILDKIMEDVSK